MSELVSGWVGAWVRACVIFFLFTCHDGTVVGVD